MSISQKIEKIHPALWQAICLGISIFTFLLILTPNFLRSVSMTLRFGFGIVFPAVFILLYVLQKIPGRMGELFSLAGTMALFTFALAGLWASGGTQSILISGLLPVSDAVAYYTDAQKILHGIQISDFSAMRPFFPGFLSLLLWVTDRNLMQAVAILTAIAGFAGHLSAREIRRAHGPAVSAFFLTLMFLYFRHHSGTTMSESLGLPVSLLGFALLWRGAASKHDWTTLFGIAMIAFALNVRPGAMFVLPALLIWGGFMFRGNTKFSMRFFLTGILLVAGTFALNRALIRLLAGPDATAFTNFSWALYGLVSGGKSWTYIFEAHPEATGQGASIYKLILDQFLQNPGLAAQGAVKYWRAFFSSSWYNAYAFVAGGNYWLNEAARYGMYLLGGLGLFKWWRNRADPFSGIALAGALGVLASVPFVPPTDAYRVRLYAATIPFFALLPAMGLSLIVERIRSGNAPQRPDEMQPSNPAAIFSILLAALMVVSPILLQSTGQMPQFEASACPPETIQIVIRYEEGAYINIHRESVHFLDWMPNYHIGVFRNNAHDLADSNLTWRLKEVNPPATLFYALDFVSNREALVIAQTDQLPEPESLLSLCGVWDESAETGKYNIFFTETVEIIE